MQNKAAVESYIDEITGGQYKEVAGRIIVRTNDLPAKRFTKSFEDYVLTQSPDAVITQTGGNILIEDLHDSIKSVLESDEDLSDKVAMLALKAITDKEEFNHIEDPEDIESIYSESIQSLGLNEEEANDIIQNYDFELPSLQDTQDKLRAVYDRIEDAQDLNEVNRKPFTRRK